MSNKMITLISLYCSLAIVSQVTAAQENDAVITSKDACRIAEDRERDFIKACFQVLDTETLISHPIFLKEVNDLPPFAKYDTDVVNIYSKARIVHELGLGSNNSSDITRMRVQLYNSLPPKGGDSAADGIFRTKFTLFSRHYKNASEYTDRYALQDPLRGLVEANMIDAPNSPASVTTLVYPPPLIPGWSEKYEPERWAAAQKQNSTTAPAPVTVGQSFEVTAHVKNDGASAPTTDMTIEYFVDGKKVTDTTFGHVGVVEEVDEPAPDNKNTLLLAIGGVIVALVGFLLWQRRA